ncbi:cysteine--tRNA ligase [Candidatus Bathyarchaeota archaeon RBG_13_38_9]|nr:MAG: cysteine--tRNA ligase [Candidatus Bathyarchaeota archaeon RBG_13_38_9]
MVFRVMNTMSGTEEEFKPIHKNRVNMFVCGPTVYDHAHIGHARTYLAYDVIARYLRYKGFSLFYLMNITDVDDKIIERAKQRKINPLELSKNFNKEFLDDMLSLNMLSTNLFAIASEHIPEMIDQIQRLLEKGYAYRVNGDIYFKISEFPDYGRLSGQKPEELKKHRIEPDPKKKDPSDFSLWKSRSKDELGWNSPWGWGRPGWHIEDTAITETYFGPQYDIHGGALELVFPHHEAEIAQAEAVTGKKPLVKYWIHTGMVNVKGQKMSKSLGNFVTIKEILQKYNSNVLRIFFASSHYRSPIDYNEKNLENARENFRTISNAYNMAKNTLDIKRSKRQNKDSNYLDDIQSHKNKFMEAMDDDFNTPIALSVMISFSKKLEAYVKEDPDVRIISESIQMLDDFCTIFGVNVGRVAVSEPKALEDFVELIIELRDEARKRNDWKAADRIREKLSSMKISIEDSSEGTKWQRVE